MKAKWYSKILGVFIIVISMMACDTPSVLLVNGVPNYSISTDCGVVNITGTTLTNDRIKFNFIGDFVVNIDSLNITNGHTSNEKSNVSILYKNKILKDTKRTINIHGKDTITLIINNKYPIKYAQKSIVVFKPSSFIMCNGSPIINKSILISK